MCWISRNTLDALASKPSMDNKISKSMLLETKHFFVVQAYKTIVL